MSYNKPYDYICCFADDKQCARRSTCLRSIAGLIDTDISTPIRCVHPRYIDMVAKGKECSFYREDRKVRMAYGFVHLFDNVPMKKATEARERLIKEVFPNRAEYYRRRLGHGPITPELQARIAEVFKELEIYVEPEFDSYVEQYNWIEHTE